ncbi:MAG: ornithine cyclodeaminase [Acidimicrobiia bacterium]|nr:ornithine cyclodeaminase [Acidimicrobiia bacterium]MDH4306340.1 ornithine cyclodeaminase [Acidimicrobiia bacterium]
MELRHITAQEIRERLDILGLIEALRSGHRGPAPDMERVLMTDDGNTYLVWHAWDPGNVVVTKMVTVFPSNPTLQPPVPSVQGVITAFDGATGRPLAVVDGTELTYWKTAASSGLAADMLARADAVTLLMVGSGGLAPYLAMAHRAVRPTIERVLIWNRTMAKAEAMAEDPMIGPGAVVVTDLEAAVAEADIVSSATASPTPLIHGRHVRPGTHLDLVGGFTPAMREADDDAVTNARLFVDAAMFNVDHCGDLCQPIAAGLIARDAIADLFDLCRGDRIGRESDEEVTLYKSGGGAHLDLMATVHTLGVTG